ncbi:MAG: RNA polymerase sigma factor [Blastochloris sp.]|jgi:RNA polymerase sigma-70 factor (ECF subfamily)|nr:RNA polymerase sigma factor [Blastochloris sp.]
MDVSKEVVIFSEPQWLLAARSLDTDGLQKERAWETLHQHYYKPLWSAVNHILQDESLTEDVVQEAFVKAFRSFDRFQGNSKVSTWLYRITINHCYDALRKRSRRQKWLGLFPLQDDEESQPHEAIDTQTGAHAAEHRDRHAIIQKALEKLSPDQRAVVELRLIQGLSTEETAQILRIQKGTVLSRLFYSCQKLKKLLQENYEEL